MDGTGPNAPTILPDEDGDALTQMQCQNAYL